MTQGIMDYKINDSFDGFMLIKEVRKGIASNGKPFLTLIFRDKTGEIDAKLWGATHQDEEIYVPEKVIKLKGTINEFNDQDHIIINIINIVISSEYISISDSYEIIYDD